MRGGRISMQVVTRLMTRGITMDHPGFSSAYEQEATRQEEAAAQSVFQRWWSWLKPHQRAPAQRGGEIACGTWTAEEAARHPALQDILRRSRMSGSPDRIAVTWRVGSRHLTVCVSHGQHDHLIAVPL